jgi:hypothetical protein
MTRHPSPCDGSCGPCPGGCGKSRCNCTCDFETGGRERRLPRRDDGDD